MQKLIDIGSEPTASLLKLLIQDKTTKKNIIWATDTYEAVTANKGRFEDDYSKNIRGYKVYGMTVHQKLFPSDEKDRYFHIYYSDSKKASEKGELTGKIARLAKYFKKHRNQAVHFERALEHYFDLIYWHEGQKDEKLLYAR